MASRISPDSSRCPCPRRCDDQQTCRGDCMTHDPPAQLRRAANTLERVGATARGYVIYREPNGVGGHRYWSDEIGGGTMVWDTSLADPETLRECLRIEGRVRP